MATVGLARAVQPLCSLRQPLQGSLLAVCHVYIKNPGTPIDKHMTLYTLVHTRVKRAVKGNSTCLYSFYVYLVLGGWGLTISSSDRRYRSAPTIYSSGETFLQQKLQQLLRAQTSESFPQVSFHGPRLYVVSRFSSFICLSCHWYNQRLELPRPFPPLASVGDKGKNREKTTLSCS